jgi:hypothetical protein
MTSSFKMLSFVPLGVGKSNVCQPNWSVSIISGNPFACYGLQGATTAMRFLVVNRQATVGMRCVPGSVTVRVSSWFSWVPPQGTSSLLLGP